MVEFYRKLVEFEPKTSKIGKLSSNLTKSDPVGKQTWEEADQDLQHAFVVCNLDSITVIQKSDGRFDLCFIPDDVRIKPSVPSAIVFGFFSFKFRLDSSNFFLGFSMLGLQWKEAIPSYSSQ